MKQNICRVQYNFFFLLHLYEAIEYEHLDVNVILQDFPTFVIFFRTCEIVLERKVFRFSNDRKFSLNKYNSGQKLCDFNGNKFSWG